MSHALKLYSSRGALIDERVLGATCPVSSIKGEVKKKDIHAGWIFPCFAAQLIKCDLF